MIPKTKPRATFSSCSASNTLSNASPVAAFPITLVNAAGILKAGRIEDTSLELWDEMLNINLRSVFHLMRLAVPHLERSRGNIVNVSSVTGPRSFPGPAFDEIPSASRAPPVRELHTDQGRVT